MSEEAENPDGKPEAARALVPVERGATSALCGHIRPLATFLAQMLACRARVADFRLHRRAQPADAAARYDAAPEQRRTCAFERIL